MMRPIDETHDARVESWVESANRPNADFPIQNLPFGVFRRRGSGEAPRVGVAIGDQALDVAACTRSGVLAGEASLAAHAVNAPSLNPLLALGPASWSALRRGIHELLRKGSPEKNRNRDLLSSFLVPLARAELFVPAAVGDHTDFYASVYHAGNVGSLFRPANPLLPNYKYVPVAYHGRTSSIVVSGTAVKRPRGQSRPEPEKPPMFGSTARLDYELEVGFFVGPGNPLGEPVSVENAGSHLFGVCLVNDWSARDIQAWEYQPLGPFLGKNFATSVSPWVVTLDALVPYRAPAFSRPAGDPAPLAYLLSEEDQKNGGIEITLEVLLSSKTMRERGGEPLRVSSVNFREMYWTAAQMLTHHTSNGCNVRPGDLLASGTVSGQANDSWGSLLELTRGGARPISLPTGEQRRFLEDGDEVVLRGYCERAGFRRIGLGECRGRIVP